MSNHVTIITEPTGKRFVLINDLRFKGKTKEEWKIIEEYLKEYIGKYYEISETAEKCRDFSDKTRVRIVLCGERDNPIPLSEALLREYLPLLAGTEILDKTTEKLNYTELMKEYSLRGAFARNLRPYLESSDGSVREKGILALKYGLEALKK